MTKYKISGLVKMSVADRIVAFSEIPPETTELDLSGNNFSKIPLAELVAALNSIPDGVNSLLLCNTGLSQIDITELKQIFVTAHTLSPLRVKRA